MLRPEIPIPVPFRKNLKDMGLFGRRIGRIVQIFGLSALRQARSRLTFGTPPTPSPFAIKILSGDTFQIIRPVFLFMIVCPGV